MVAMCVCVSAYVCVCWRLRFARTAENFEMFAAASPRAVARGLTAKAQLFCGIAVNRGGVGWCWLSAVNIVYLSTHK